MKEEYIKGAQGVAIVAIVCAEVLRRLHEAGFLQDDQLARAMVMIHYTTITAGYPCLFFLFGLRAVASLRRSRWGFVKMTLYGVAYPYLLWSALQMAVLWLVAQYAKHGFPLADFARIGWDPIDQFGFLYALCICHLVACATVWSQSGRHILASLGNRVLLAVLAMFCAFLAIRTEWGIVTSTLWGLTFFLAGVLFAPAFDVSIERSVAGRGALLAAAILFVGAILLGQRDGGDMTVFALLASLASVVTALLIAKLLAKRRLGHLLITLGAAWMPIYLLHVMVTAVVWNGLLAAGIDWSVVHALVGTAVGIAVPYMVYRLAKKSRCAQLVGFDPVHLAALPEARHPPIGDFRTRLERPLP